jgi:hypothetical protein
VDAAIWHDEPFVTPITYFTTIAIKVVFSGYLSNSRKPSRSYPDFHGLHVVSSRSKFGNLSCFD